MSEILRVLTAIQQGDPHAAEQLFPLVYDELRKLAVQRLAHEKPGQTLQATALVHEVYLRLVDSQHVRRWENRAHFFAAAAEAMRRILVENARRKRRRRHGGDYRRVPLGDLPASERPPEDVLALDEMVTRLAVEDPVAADLVKLRIFAGFSVEEASDALAMSRSQGYRHWKYARAWLRCALDKEAMPTATPPEGLGPAE
jgi:RNA polymerase sigma factor (TIGR02999 family)